MRALFALLITLRFGCVIQEDYLIVDPENRTLLNNLDTCESTSLDHRGKRCNGFGEYYNQVARNSLANYQTVEHHCLRNIGSKISATESEENVEEIASSRRRRRRRESGFLLKVDDRYRLRKPFSNLRRTLSFGEDLEKDLKTSSRKERCSDHVKGRTKIFPANCGRETRRDDPEYLDDDADSATEEEDEDEDVEKGDSTEWDTWTEWSECSASCGCGRQVRWQHCIGKGCSFGLKKAQIRTCHLRDCNAKNLFSWLGVKP